MSWDVEFTDEFEDWWVGLSAGEQDDVDAVVGLLESKGPSLPFPYSSGVSGSRHAHMRELRIQHAGEPYRVLYAFDPRRCAILLIGGDKKPVRIGGMSQWFRRRIGCMMSTWMH